MKLLTSSLATVGLLTSLAWTGVAPAPTQAELPQASARPVFHLRRAAASTTPVGLTPAQIKAAYRLPATGGSGTIAIVDAYSSLTIGGDLATFSSKFNLPACSTANGCFEIHPMRPVVQSNAGWALEMALDVEWAHAVAPSAKILLVEARSDSLADLLAAVDYARSRSDVTAVSMSWGAAEFAAESQYDSHFTSATGASFFAASGDWGHEVDWPAVASPVVAVGGTSLSLGPNNQVISETAWNGSGGGLSLYEDGSAAQTSFGTPANPVGKRAVPDVSYNADPTTGVAVYTATHYNRQAGWFQIGGTSAGAPQWAAIHALGHSATAAKLYHAAAAPTAANVLRDIVSGSNGACAAYCAAAAGYDYVTGLGSPLTASF